MICKVILALLAIVTLLALSLWSIVVLYLNSEDHSQYDYPRHFNAGIGKESEAHRNMARLIGMSMQTGAPTGRERLSSMRAQFDERGLQVPIDASIIPTDAGGVPAEWIVDPNADPRRRLIYFHGGGYTMGSPQSHRPITARLSRLTRSMVLSVAYRLMPEHSRLDGIEDCWTAYQWVLANGPDGPNDVTTLIVAGDSAGGNLALVTIARSRDEGMRAADAVVVMSPQTDITLSSPSLVRNAPYDVMQGLSFGPVVRAPKTISLWMMFVASGVRPNNPIVSPLLGDLSGLPPTLLQASESEMFLDDAVRYANKALAQGSIAVVQTWPHTMHVWHAFEAPEADDAYYRIAEFIALHTGN